MQTIKDWIFKALYRTKEIPKSALTLEIYLASHCDVNGRISIYHRDIEETLCIDTKTFYASVKFLENTFVTINLPNGNKIKTPLIIREPKDKNCNAEIILKIPYNDFEMAYAGEDKPFSNYINIDFVWLKAQSLKTMHHAEIRVLMYLFFRLSKSGDVTNDLVFKSKFTAYKAIAEQLGISVQTVRKAIAHLRKAGIIKIGCSVEYSNNGHSLAFPVHRTTFSLSECTVAEIQNPVTASRDQYGRNKMRYTTEKHFRSDRHTVRNILRRKKKSNVSLQELNDIAALVHQYRTTAASLGRKIESVIEQAISNCVIIKAKLVHSSIKDILCT
ncbi:HTH domain-containing protein [Ruminococcus albus]|uniref:Helix-turn-helix type 11 domain-containing protein n=1 Tax=Ruminococcus albus (strain ATCC 27210 / DSM 20455 / JCM 14654 / NCDO 2250 / 7) TaxID=697329 RepID=E6UL69_RUMA7|nr:HTH domain-containing protein [Ruminococcus albus]ADU24415.1 hypothetical protein Rumal_3992 [Ruminococcus albus 7 = DSM 20455]